VLGGAYFFRNEKLKSLAYLLWGCSPVLGLILIISAFLIIL
jgi:hypothetical protein